MEIAVTPCAASLSMRPRSLKGIEQAGVERAALQSSDVVVTRLANAQDHVGAAEQGFTVGLNASPGLLVGRVGKARRVSRGRLHHNL